MDPRIKNDDVKVKVATSQAGVDTMTLGLVVLFVVSILGLLLGRAASGM